MANDSTSALKHSLAENCEAYKPAFVLDGWPFPQRVKESASHMVAIDKPVVRQEEANYKCTERMTTFWKPIIKIAFLVLPLNLHKFKVSIAVIAHAEYRWGLSNLKTTECTTRSNGFDTSSKQKIPYLTSWDRL